MAQTFDRENFNRQLSNLEIAIAMTGNILMDGQCLSPCSGCYSITDVCHGNAVTLFANNSF